MECITIKCNKERGTRGLCSTCYFAARRIMREGIATEEQLVNRGMIEVRKTKKAENLFINQFKGI